MDAFATADQYIDRYGEVPASAVAVLDECLLDATAVIRGELERRGIDADEVDGDYRDRLMRVCRSMANRIMPQGSASVPVGATQVSMTAGSYNRQFTFSSPYGTPKMLPSEMRLLGLSASKAGWTDLGGDGHVRHRDSDCHTQTD